MTRINVELVHGRQHIVLFADSSHPEMDVEQLVYKEVALYGRQPTRLLASLIDQRYPSDAGAHRAGERVLSLDMQPGERERDAVLRIALHADGARVERVDAASAPQFDATDEPAAHPVIDLSDVDEANTGFAASVLDLLRLARATQRASSGERWTVEVRTRPAEASGATWPEDIRWRDQS